MRALPSRPHAAAAVAAAAVGALRRGIGRRPRPASFDACQQQQQRRALSATTGGGKDKDEGEDDGKTTEAPTNETAHFNVVAAEARGDPSRRFTVSTDGQRRQKGVWV